MLLIGKWRDIAAPATGKKVIGDGDDLDNNADDDNDDGDDDDYRYYLWSASIKELFLTSWPLLTHLEQSYLLEGDVDDRDFDQGDESDAIDHDLDERVSISIIWIHITRLATIWSWSRIIHPTALTKLDNS